jgi:predicted DNA-binding WGR domain protein
MYRVGTLGMSVMVGRNVMDYRSLRYQDEKSAKFWSIALSGCSHTVNYGRFGTDGQTQTKDFATEDTARKSYDKLVAEKVKKGYVDDRDAIGFCAGRGYANANAPPTAVTATNLPHNLPANWQELAFQEIQAHLVQNKKQLCELAAIDVILNEYLNLLNVEIRTAIASNLFDRCQLFCKLVNNEHENVRIALAKNSYTPLDILTILSKDKSPQVRLAVANNKSGSIEILEYLSNDAYRNISKAATANINYLTSIVHAIARNKQSNLYWNISSEEDISVSLIVPDSKTFSGTYLHAYKSMLSSVSGDERSIAIGLDPHTSTRVLENLAKNKTSWAGSVMDSLGGSLARYHVQESVAFNPSSPPDLLHTLELEKDIFIHLALASNKNTPTEILTNIAFSKNLKCDIKHSFGLSSDGYDKSYQNYLEFLYLSIAHHPNTSDEVLQAILSKKIGMYSSRYTPISLIRSCNGNLVRNTFSPAEAARYFYQKRCADRSSHRSAILAESIKSLNTFSRFFALLAIQDLNTISSIVQQSTNWLDRYAIAQNLSTPKDVLEKLAEDEHLFVRAAARSALGLEVICSPSVATVKVVAIEENPRAIVTTPVIESVPIELKIERSIDLNPEDWLWATGRVRESKPRSEPKPFDLQDALNRLKQIEGESLDRQHKLSGFVSTDWNNAEIDMYLSPEEANFWLIAMTCDLPLVGGRPSGLWTNKNIAYLVEILETKCLKPSPEFREVISILLRDWRTIYSPIVRPLNNLFSIILIIVEIYRFHQSDDLSARQYIELIFGRDYLEKYAADRPAYSPEQVIQAMATVLRGEVRSLLDRLIQGFKSFIHPYLTDEEIRVMQEQLRPALNIQTNAFHLYKLAAYLGMHEEVRVQIATWQLNQPTANFVKTATGHLQSPEAIEIIFGLGNPEEIETNVRSLTIPISKPEHIRGWFANMEFTALDLVCKSINTDEQLAVFTLAKAPEVAPYMLELWLSLKKPQLARQWLEDYPIYAVVGLIPVVAGTWVDPVRVKLSELKKAAIEFLLSMKRKGYESLIRSALELETPEIAAKVRSLILDVAEPNYTPFDRATTPEWLQAGIMDLPKQKRAKPPTWVSYADLPPIVIGDRCLDEAQINACLSALSLSTLDSPLPLVQHLKTHANRQILDTFSWSLFERWLTEGAPNREKWAMMALGLLGSDTIAMKLTPLIRTWPGESQHARAVLGLECLRSIGSDTALMQIHGIAQKIKFQGLKSRAQDCMAAIARDRQLTAEQLADRIVPDCGLDDRGQRSFDFGGRQFQFLLGLDLKPMLRDPQGKKITTLPKPNSKDDPELAATAIADWKLMKKQISEVAKLHSLRLERAMVEHRTWSWQDFETLLVCHPLLTHLVQRTIWATYDPQGSRQTTFRVAEDHTYTDAQDNPYSPDLQASVGIPHPLTLDDTSKSLWGEILSDYEIIPPFPQLGRDTYVLSDIERDGEEIDRFAKIPISGALLARMMDDRGWLKGGLHDHGDYQVHYKYFPQGDVTAIIGDYEYQHVQQSSSYGDAAMNGCLFLKGESAQPYEYPRTGSWYAQHSKLQCLKLGEVDSIVISETIRDMNSIVTAAQAKS